MAQIQLSILRGIHAPARAIGRHLSAIRLTANVSLAAPTGWSSFRPAVIDTGAPVSVFPAAVWRRAEYSALGRVRIGGIVRREECRIPALLAKVNCALSDGKHTLGPLRIYAYLAEAEDSPTLIGVLSFIERGILKVDLAGRSATLQLT